MKSAGGVPNEAVDGLMDKRGSLDSKASIGSGGSVGNVSSQGAPSQTPNSTYKSWVASSLKKSANMALKINLSVKVKHMVYGKSKPPDSLGNPPSPNRRPFI